MWCVARAALCSQLKQFSLTLFLCPEPQAHAVWCCEGEEGRRMPCKVQVAGRHRVYAVNMLHWHTWGADWAAFSLHVSTLQTAHTEHFIGPHKSNGTCHPIPHATSWPVCCTVGSTVQGTIGPGEAGCWRQGAVLHNDHYRQVLLRVFLFASTSGRLKSTLTSHFPASASTSSPIVSAAALMHIVSPDKH